MSDRYCEFCTIYDGEPRPCNEAGQCPRDPSHLTSSLDGIVRETKRRHAHAIRKAMGWVDVQHRLEAILEKLGQWPTPCEDEFRRLAREQPATLLRWIQSGVLLPGDLTHAVAIAGCNLSPESNVVSVLYPLTTHENPVVREGAVLGLAAQIDIITDRLKFIEQTDSSAGVRATIRGILET